MAFQFQYFCTIMCKSNQQSSSGNFIWRSGSTISRILSNCEYRGLLTVYDYMFRHIGSSSGRPHKSKEEALLMIFYKFAGTYASLWTFRTTCIEIREEEHYCVLEKRRIFHLYLLSRIFDIKLFTLQNAITNTAQVSCVCVLGITTTLINKSNTNKTVMLAFVFISQVDVQSWTSFFWILRLSIKLSSFRDNPHRHTNIHTYIHTHTHTHTHSLTYLLTYLLHGAESFLRS